MKLALKVSGILLVFGLLFIAFGGTALTPSFLIPPTPYEQLQDRLPPSLTIIIEDQRTTLSRETVLELYNQDAELEVDSNTLGQLIESHFVNIGSALSISEEVLQMFRESVEQESVTFLKSDLYPEGGVLYVKNRDGLESYMRDISAGRRIAIGYTDLHDRGWSANHNQNELFQMASTYKMFVAYSALKRVDDGSWSLDTPLYGTTLRGCIDTMIIDSDNECSHAIADRIGWDVIVAEAAAIGATGLDWSEDVHGTVADDVTLLTKLGKGELLSQSSRDYLFGIMKNQRFREGIPAGTTHPVADKVGFIFGNLHDAAIVYAPDKPYVLVIFTQYESWAEIAEITRAVEKFVL